MPTRHARRAAPVLFALVVAVVAGAGSRSAAGAETDRARPSFALPTEAEFKGATGLKLAVPAPTPPAQGDRLTDRAKEFTGRYKPLDYDPDLWAKELGGGIEPVFQYVRDQVRFETYPGVLRGAKSAYILRAGNAPDRSLLLARLLDGKGVKTRFAWGRLSRESAGVLLARMFEGNAKAAEPATDGRASGVAGADGAAAPDFAGRVRARALRDYAAVRTALGENFAAGVGASAEALVDEVVPHVWVQAEVGGKWVDLDTAFADAAPGKTYCAAEQTAERLPDDFHQRVTIRVVVERLRGGALIPETVLEEVRPAVDLLERQVFLVHIPTEGFKGLGAAVAGAQKQWVPTLWVDGEFFPGKGFAYDAAGGNAGAVAAKPPGGLGDAFDVLSADPPAPKAQDADAAQFVSESLEFEVTFPGGRKETARRVLCDRGGAAWRKAAPLDPAKLTPLPRDDSGPLAAQAIRNVWFSAGATDMASYAQGLELFAAATPPRPAGGSKDPAPVAPPGGQPGAPAAQQADDDDFGLSVWPVALQNLSCVLWGDHAFLPALNDDPSARLYVASPRILLFGLTALPAPGNPDKVYFETAIDLRRDELRGVARPGDAAAAAAAAWRKVWYGVLEGALEHELVAVQALAIAGRTDVSSTSALLDARGVAALRPGQAGAAAGAAPETAAQLAAALDAGDTLVVPRAVLEANAAPAAGTGWWAVSAASGTTRAVWDEGHGGGFGVGGNYIPGRSGNTGAGGTNWVDPATGAGRRPPGAGPMADKKRGGNEYAQLLISIPIPGGRVLRITITPALRTVLFEVVARLP